MNLIALNAKQKKSIQEMVKKQFGYDKKIDFQFLLNEKDQKIFIASHTITKIHLDKLNINSIGLPFATIHEDSQELRLTVEGSQIIGKHATKNAIKLSKTDTQDWLQGRNISYESQEEPTYKIIQNHTNDFLGCARLKENVLLNFLPKARRVSQIIE